MFLKNLKLEFKPVEKNDMTWRQMLNAPRQVARFTRLASRRSLFWDRTIGYAETRSTASQEEPVGMFQGTLNVLNQMIR